MRLETLVAFVVIAAIERELRGKTCGCYGCLTLGKCDYRTRFVVLGQLYRGYT